MVIKQFYIYLILICALSLTGCGDAEEETAGSEELSGGTETNAGSNTGSNTGSVVTVGVFSYDDATDTYTDLNKDFVFEVGKECQTWSRRVAMPTERDEIQEPHDHYNAADEVVYENGSISWVEYGPVHSQDEIDDLCASKMNGKTKTGITADEYYDDGNMGLSFYLKIKSVE